MSNVELQAGTRQITLFVTGGGFNLNQMVFFLFATGIDDDENLIEDFRLDQNYPNPFNPSTTIQYALPQTANVLIRIVDTQGRIVRELENRQVTSGIHSVVWDGNADNGQAVSSGVYYYTLQALDGKQSLFNQSKKLILLK